LQTQIDGISITTPGAIAGLVDGNVGNNSPIVQQLLGGPAGVWWLDHHGRRGAVECSDLGRLRRHETASTLTRRFRCTGARVGARSSLIPDKRLPGLVPGTPGTGTRTGGGGPGSVIRPVRRSPQINKQAFQGVIRRLQCIDMTGVTASKAFTCNASGVFTSSGHGRLNGDIVFFDSDSIGTALPSPLLNGNDSALAHSYKVTNATTNTFQVNSYDAGTKTWPIPVTTAAGNGVWSTNVCGIRVPNRSRPRT
jgi:hypothetical protein